MSTRFDDDMRVTFPSTRDFVAVGRVAAVGLALRLGFDISQVENLRLAVEQAITYLSGSGSITMNAQWNDSCLVLDLHNDQVTPSPDQLFDLTLALDPLVSNAVVQEHLVAITIKN